MRQFFYATDVELLELRVSYGDRPDRLACELSAECDVDLGPFVVHEAHDEHCRSLFNSLARRQATRNSSG